MRRSLQILLVEPHDSSNSSLKKMLSRRGHEISLADSAEQALAMVRFQRFDLLISDIQLQGISGRDLLVELRKHQPELKAIALSGYVFQIDMRQSDFDLHLSKQAEMPQIEHLIERLFAKDSTTL